MPLTPAQARELWASELESGKWKQGTGQLARETDHGTEYCCLGVACELAVREGIINSYNGADTSLEEPYGPVREWLGIWEETGSYKAGGELRSLTGENDAGATFKQIAATIRNELEGLIA